MFPSRIIRAAQAIPAELKPFDFARNPYKAKQTWPPDFEKLSDRHQFRLERRYKRRSKLKWARPRMMVATKLAQWIGGVSVLVYGILYMDWNDNGEAFQSARNWYRNTIGGVTAPAAPRPRAPVQAQDQPGR